jgi:hypothetical protein
LESKIRGVRLLEKYYEEAKYNAAFDRCVDVMGRLFQKYGRQVLDKLEQDNVQSSDIATDDMDEQVLEKERYYIRAEKIFKSQENKTDGNEA